MFFNLFSSFVRDQIFYFSDYICEKFNLEVEKFYERSLYKSKNFVNGLFWDENFCKGSCFRIKNFCEETFKGPNILLNRSLNTKVF